jgi:hypothetical protein
VDEHPGRAHDEDIKTGGFHRLEGVIGMATDDVRPGGGPALDDPEMSQEEQARDLTEPVFDHHIENEGKLLAEEFGPPDASGWYDRGPDGYEGEAGS